MAKWYVEYKDYGKLRYMGKIEAKDGKEAIQYIKDNVCRVANSFKVWHDDDEE